MIIKKTKGRASEWKIRGLGQNPHLSWIYASTQSSRQIESFNSRFRNKIVFSNFFTSNYNRSQDIRVVVYSISRVFFHADLLIFDLSKLVIFPSIDSRSPGIHVVVYSISRVFFFQGVGDLLISNLSKLLNFSVNWQ